MNLSKNREIAKVSFVQVSSFKVYQIKGDTMQLDFDTIFIKITHFKSHKYFKFCALIIQTLDTKTTIYCLGDTEIQLKN